MWPTSIEPASGVIRSRLSTPAARSLVGDAGSVSITAKNYGSSSAETSLTQAV